MKMIKPTLILSLTALLATSAIAAPAYHATNDHHSSSQSHWDRNDARWHNNSHQHYKTIKPARDWRVGQTLPRQFNSRHYEVSYKDAARLYKPNRNQQWLKINGDYVLINERNAKIMRIIA
ncbi:MULTISPECIES: RcnB family protein [unclassified Acinetobacter]|uniref:RcnB family protein n=1 Tax=unclassified Acinetobacter TaxID=196816 RepID=UPI002934D2D6|nr:MULTISPECIES: RcnB family protein [unclassified Acinetobacter]WOE30810.1 RcnB family protein [Acinetobacter sp. SAAs470]WOE39005.1 RcnB family protein [Acinetobacter sp. SAAs474]